MEVDVRMTGKPVIIFLVGCVVVQDHVNFLVNRRFGYYIIKKSLEVRTLLDCRDCNGQQKSDTYSGSVVKKIPLEFDWGHVVYCPSKG